MGEYKQRFDALDNKVKAGVVFGTGLVILGSWMYLRNRLARSAEMQLLLDRANLRQVPGWENVNLQSVTIKPLLGGLSNTLYVVNVNQPVRIGAPVKVVVRVFGSSTMLIDSFKVNNA